MRFLNTLRCALVLLAGLAFQAPSGAAILTFNHPNCSAFTLTQTTPGNYALQCTSMVCTLTATPASQLPNQQVALAASCTPPLATVTSWTASGGCTTPAAGATQGQATVMETAEKTCVYTANVTDGTLLGQGNVTVVWANTPPPAPTGCSITRTPSDGNLTTAGGAISANVTCTGGGPANTWTWRKNGTSYAATQSINDSLPSNALTTPVTTTYDVVACNGPSCAPLVATTFTVAGTAPPSLCTQYQNVVNYNLPWGGYADTHQQGTGFLANGVMVGKFTVPATWPTKTSTGSASAVEYIDAGTYRTFTLSTQPCDFRTSTDSTGVNGPLWRVVDQRPGVWFTVGGTPPFYATRLTAGQTYYVNIRNTDNAGNITCGGATCNMRVNVSTPP